MRKRIVEKSESHEKQRGEGAQNVLISGKFKQCLNIT